MHIPKTGGMWVREFLNHNGLTSFDIKNVPGLTYTTEGTSETQHNIPLFNPEFVRSTYVFSFVRNPVEWYRSYWAFKMGWRWHIHKNFDAKTASSFFGDFVENVIREYPRGYLTRTYNFYTDVCTHVGKQENLKQHLNAFITDIGYNTEKLDWDLPLENVTAAELKMHAIYTPRLLEKIIENEREIMEKYDYSMDVPYYFDTSNSMVIQPQ